MKVKSCKQCQKEMLKAATDEFLKHEYAILKDSSYSFFTYAICCVLGVMEKRGKTPKYVRDIYDDMCFIFSQQDLFGKKIEMTDIMHHLEDKYGIDWGKLEIHMESEQEFIRNMKEAKL